MPEFIRLKKSNCKNCYKCIRNCPVKSIRFSGNQAHIVADECILCGQCFVVCPQNAKEILDSVEIVKTMIAEGSPVIASVAPSFAANYGCNIASLETALKKLGFAAAEETAIGASIVKDEYNRILREEKPDVLISSCCHTVNLMIQKYYPEALKYLAPVASPMQAHCKDIKKRFANARTVFIGPCISKKDEAYQYQQMGVDAVLTFEELSHWLKDGGVSVPNETEALPRHLSRLFPTDGGIIKAMAPAPDDSYRYISVSGLEDCAAILSDLSAGTYRGCFIEMSSCKGSCAEGPAMETRSSRVGNLLKIQDYAGNEDPEIPAAPKAELHKNMQVIPSNKILPTEQEIAEILRRMGRSSPSRS